MDNENKQTFCRRLTALCRELGVALDADRMRLYPDDGRFYLATGDERVFAAFPVREEDLP